MKVKEWLEITKPKKQKNDILEIYCIERFSSGITINHYVEIPHDLEKYPLLNDADIIEQSADKAPYTLGIGGASGTLTIYSALINLDQYKIAKGQTIKKERTKGKFRL